MSKRVAIMQPYFFPYAGYFRLFTSVDEFIILDTVQFPKGGWVNRNRLLDRDGRPRWLTLPLKGAPLATTIGEMEMRDDARQQMESRLAAFPPLGSPEQRPALYDCLLATKTSLCDYLEMTLRYCLDHLGIAPPAMLRASSLAIDGNLHGQDRVIALVRAAGGDCYINSPGGRELYSGADFDAAGIELRFLTEYNGPSMSILQRFGEQAAASLRKDILEQSETEAA